MPLHDLLRFARDWQERVPYEVGTFVILEASEKALAEESLWFWPDGVQVGQSGEVKLVPNQEGQHDVEGAVALLSEVVESAGSGVPPRLVALTARPPHDLRSFRDALEAALVPLNRRASRRVLARWVRDAEARGVPLRGVGVHSPEDFDLTHAEATQMDFPAPTRPPVSSATGAESVWSSHVRASAPLPIDSSATLSGMPAAPMATSGTTSAGGGSAALDTLSELDVAMGVQQSALAQEELGSMVRPASRLISEGVVPASHVDDVDDGREAAAVVPPVAERRRASGTRIRIDRGAGTAPELPEQAGAENALAGLSPWTGQPFPWVRLWAGTTVLLFALCLFLYFRPGVRPPPGDPSTSAGSGQALGVLRLSCTAGSACQWFHFEGRSPVTVGDLGQGPHEFLALRNNGELVGRGRVGRGRGDSSGTQELTLALTASAGEPSDPGEPLGRGGSTAGPGAVRVLTRPSGARVYRFFGRAELLQTPALDRRLAHEFVVTVPGRVLQRVLVAPSDWKRAKDGSWGAEISISGP